MKTKKDTRTAEEKKKALKAALREAGLDAWSPGSPAPETPNPDEPAKGDRPSRGGET
jgi:hypothetical protein